ncbi:hypothetical protein I6A84_44500 [Frankia sp. CNm7]|uniref:Uncharacterized protein n=2 Tax=Frankia nepalensis TaxID=1836974 RepID=A0A937UTF9_9ACTN|nr:hypothetical protein [Frankia nepalensis]MBL7524912.1 hypothetical protein [Frankia nepalensis]MBL7633542.1 hypothetical protein [Frankia nepalensis]
MTAADCSDRRGVWGRGSLFAWRLAGGWSYEEEQGIVALVGGSRLDPRVQTVMCLYGGTGADLGVVARVGNTWRSRRTEG